MRVAELEILLKGLAARDDVPGTIGELIFEQPRDCEG
jgi:hypothetical protein